MELAEKVLEAMKIAGVPLNAGKIVELTGLERTEVDKAMKKYIFLQFIFEKIILKM